MVDHPDLAALDGLERPGAPRSRQRLLWIIGALEALSLAILLVNIVAGNAPSVAQAVGPVHGLLYVAGIALVWTTDYRRVPKLLSIIPAIGTLLAVRVQSRTGWGGID